LSRNISSLGKEKKVQALICLAVLPVSIKISKYTLF